MLMMEEHFEIRKTETDRKVIFQLFPKINAQKELVVEIGGSPEEMEVNPPPVDEDEAKLEEAKSFLLGMARKKEKEQKRSLDKYVTLVPSRNTIEKIQKEENNALVERMNELGEEFQGLRKLMQTVFQRLQEVGEKLGAVSELELEPLVLLLGHLKPEMSRKYKDELVLDFNQIKMKYNYQYYNFEQVMNENLDAPIGKVDEKVDEVMDRNTDLRHKVIDVENRLVEMDEGSAKEFKSLKEDMVLLLNHLKKLEEERVVPKLELIGAQGKMFF